MPGNEVGDRVHNFFGQEHLSQSQQSVDGNNWSGLSNNLWVGGQRQIGGPFISSLKNYNLQQSEHGTQTSHASHGSNLKPEFGRVQTQNQQAALNGYIHGNQVFQGRQNETKFLGVDTDANQHNLALRGLSISQQENTPEPSKINSVASESPVGFDFFGGQQQMNGQHLGVLQSIPRQQQAGNSDMQLLQQQQQQQHMILQQLQELYRQQQLQQQTFTNQVVKQRAGNYSPSLINGVPVNEASNSLWQPELVPGGGAWVQRGVMPSGHTHMYNPEQGQALRLMDMVPQQPDQSLYGVPISGSYPHIQAEKPPTMQISGSPYASFPDRISMQEETRPEFQAKNVFGLATAGQGLSSSGFNYPESLQHVSHPEMEFPARQEVAKSPEPSPEKSFNQVATSHTAAALDPTEEKILFGSDDNIWEAFGKSSNMGIGDFNVLDGADHSGGFSSLQSGSWSALMQSAVAETCDGETGIQEEWCGPTVQNSEARTQNQQLSTNNFEHPIARSLGPSPPISAEPNRANSGVGSFGPPQFQQSDFRTSSAQSEMLITDSSQRCSPKFTGQGSKWSDHGAPHKQSVEHGRTCTSVSHPSGAETNGNSSSGCWNHQQITPTRYGNGEPCNRANGWSFVNSSGAPAGSNHMAIPDNQNSLQCALSGDHKSGMHEELGHVAGLWRADFAPNSNAELPTKREGRNASSLNSIAVANSSSVRSNQEGKQQLSNRNQLDVWKVVDSSATAGSKGAALMGKSQPNLVENPQIPESSGNHSLETGMVETHEMDTNSNKNYSADGFRSCSVLHHNSTADSKGNNWSDACNSRTFAGGKQKSAGVIGQNVPGTRKFQYHPMGDVDVDHELSHEAKIVTHSLTLPQQITRGLKGHDQGSLGQPNFGGYMDRTSLESEKGHLSVGQSDLKVSHATPPQNMFPGFAPSSYSPFDKGTGNHASNKVPPSSQYMLELLHKVDHQREHGSAAHLSSSERNLSCDVPETETSDGSVGHVQRNQSSSSQNSGLQLAPPSHRFSSTDHVVSSQSSQQAVFGSTREAGDMHLASRASAVPFVTSYDPSQGNGHNISVSSAQIMNKASYSNLQGGYSTAFPHGFPYARNHENQHMHDGSGQSVHMPFNRISFGSKQLDGSSERTHASQYMGSAVPELSASGPQDKFISSTETSQLIRTDHMNKQDPAQQTLEPDGSPAAQPSVQHGALSKMLPNSWTSVPCEQASPKAASNDSLATMFPGPPKPNNAQDIVEVRNSQSFTAKQQLDRDSCQPPQVLAGKVETAQKMLSVPQGNNFSGTPLASHAANQRDIEAFGRLTNSLHQNYSLLHQVQAMRSPDIDSAHRSAKRLKVSSEHVMDPQQLSYGYNSSAARDSSANQSSVPCEELKSLSFSSKQAGAAQDSNALSHSSGRSEHPHGITPRMAPSWFDRYGNGHMLQVCDMQRTSSMKSVEQPSVVGKMADVRDPSEHANTAADSSNIQQVSAPEHLTSPQLLQDATDQSLVVERPNKRKTATSELVPLHKEIMSTSQRLLTISMAEVEWAKTANRIAEKVEQEPEMVDDVALVFRPRRRLVLTTQLMQQLLRPPPAAVVSSDATSQYESSAYFTARLALGDACGATSCSETEAPFSGENNNTLSEKLKTPKAIDQHFSKVVEDFIGRARRLESVILRLDKRALILDLRVECQDLDKFSVINRFAKFHGRGQPDAPESDGTLNAQKPCPQRLVIPLPMPRNPPDMWRLGCHKLST